MKKLLALALAVAALLAGFAWVTSAGAAPPGPQYVSATQTSDPMTPVRLSVLAVCPSNTKVVGGGFDLVVSGTSSQVFPIEDSFPDVTANGWRVVYDDGATFVGNTVQVTSWAVCD